MPGELLSTIIQYQNRSGSIPSAPFAIESLKDQILGVPFQLLSPGMSGVISAGNLLGIIQKLIPLLGGLQYLGDFQKWVGKLDQMTAQDFINAMGPAAALGAGLMSQKDGVDV